jgi:hypothetical protein
MHPGADKGNALSAEKQTKITMAQGPDNRFQQRLIFLLYAFSFDKLDRLLIFQWVRHLLP